MKITLLTGKTYDLENAFDFPLEVIRARKIKRLKLRINQKQRKAVLNMPKLCPYQEAYDFVANNREWIEKHLCALPPQKNFVNGDKISICGRKLTLLYVEDSLEAPQERDGTLYVGGHEVFFHRRVRDYIRKETLRFLEKTSKELAAKIHCSLAQVHLKDTNSRWGSCSTLNNINYNWRIGLAPLCAIKYLIAHEVAHLRHHNHSEEFWNCVKNLYPNYLSGKEWLKAHGADLYLYK